MEAPECSVVCTDHVGKWRAQVLEHMDSTVLTVVFVAVLLGQLARVELLEIVLALAFDGFLAHSQLFAFVLPSWMAVNEWVMRQIPLLDVLDGQSWVHHVYSKTMNYCPRPWEAYQSQLLPAETPRFIKTVVGSQRCQSRRPSGSSSSKQPRRFVRRWTLKLDRDSKVAKATRWSTIGHQ